MNANSRTRAPGAIAVAALVAVVLAACSSLLDVQTPDIIDPGSVNNPDGAVAAYDGAIGDFAFANDGDNGATEGQILVTGVMADEYYDSETFPRGSSTIRAPSTRATAPSPPCSSTCRRRGWRRKGLQGHSSSMRRRPIPAWGKCWTSRE